MYRFTRPNYTPDVIINYKSRARDNFNHNLSNIQNQINELKTLINNITPSPSPSPTPTSNIQYAHIQERYPVGTQGEEATTGLEKSRNFNTILENTIDGLIVDSDQIKLPPGTYYINCYASATNAVAHRLRLSNLSTDYAIGPVSTATVGSITSIATASCIINSEEDIQFYVFHYTTSPGPFGTPINRLSQPEVYADMTILKLS